MTTKIAGFVLRSSNNKRTASFYQKLGLQTKEHKHGGPMHHEVLPVSFDCVMEIYPRSPVYSHDAVMIRVDSLEKALQVALEFGCEPITVMREAPQGRFVYITDPDNRPVMLIEG